MIIHSEIIRFFFFILVKIRNLFPIPYSKIWKNVINKITTWKYRFSRKSKITVRALYER